MLYAYSSWVIGSRVQCIYKDIFLVFCVCSPIKDTPSICFCFLFVFFSVPKIFFMCSLSLLSYPC